MKEKIKFKDLSFPIKYGVVAGWAFSCYTILMFTAGFIIGFMGV